jgi:heavy metal sensor kinase
MRSIRLSLIVSFLLLLAGTLGAVSWFAYQTAYRTLEEKAASTRELIESEYERRQKHVRTEFDEKLKLRTLDLARAAQPKVKIGEVALGQLGALNAGLAPQGYLSMPVWAASTPQGWRDRDFRFFAQLTRPVVNVSIEFPSDVLRWLDLAPPDEYYQLYTAKGLPLEHSPPPPDHHFVLDEKMRKQAQYLYPELDEITLKNGAHLRRVTLKAVAEREQIAFPRKNRLGGPPPRPPKQPIPLTPKDKEYFSRQNLTFFVQYAGDTASRDAKLTKAAAERDRKLEEQATEGIEQLRELRDRLWWLGLVAFLATGAGGFVLLHLGLKPLNRLSDAVSRISEKDFRLPLDGAPLPTELRPIEERLQQTLDLLKRAFAREKQAAADISHELRTPLAALMTTIEVALRKLRSPEEYREVLEDCRDSGKHMVQLVERLLALARLDAGADLLRPREVDAAVLAEQCAALVRPLAQARGLALNVRHEGESHLKTDPDKLREVLNSLLHNAVQYNRPNGSIDLEVRRDNGTLELEVRDTGIGIAPQAKEHIFERFYRADPSRQADGLNAGLGLAIVKGYVDLLGGTIRVDSAEGKGSAFRVCLPAHPEGPTN